MKLFLTGGTGFIGSHFLNAAHAAGSEVVVERKRRPVTVTASLGWFQHEC